MPTIRPQLRQWILDTTRSGHGVAEVLRLMEESGYKPQESRRIVAKVLNQPLTVVPDIRPSRQGVPLQHPEPPVVQADGQAVTVTLCLDQPPLRVLDNLLSEEECNQLVALARPRLKRAMTVAADGRHQLDERRTSEGMFFRPGEVALVQRIEQRLASLLGVPATHGEGIQVLHYMPGQEYEPHFDWFNPEEPGFQTLTAYSGQRMASVVMYLNTPEGGGGTGFPEVGLTVTARTGSAVYFAYDTGDQSSLHAGLPVTAGEKWIATKWLRERPFVG